MLLEDALRGAELVARFAGPIVDVGSGGGTPGIPLAAALPEREVTLLEAERRKCDVPASAGRPSCRTCASSGAAPRSSRSDAYGVAVAKALAPPPVAAEWCLPLVAEGGAAVLWVGPEPRTVARGRPSGSRERRLGGGASCARPRHGLLVLPQVGPDPPGFPRRPGDAPGSARCWPDVPLARPAMPRGRRSTRSRTRRAASARRRPRSTSPPASPRPASARSSSISIRRRTRPPGSASARTASPATTCSTARRSRSSREPTRVRRTSTSCRRSPSSPARRSSSRGATTASATSPRRSAGATDALRVRLPRLPALARPADRERARGRRPRARAGAGRVLRARGPVAAPGVGRLVRARLNPRLAARRRPADDGRRSHAARRRRRGRGAAAFRRARVPRRSCRVRCGSRRRRATACP